MGMQGAPGSPQGAWEPPECPPGMTRRPRHRQQQQQQQQQHDAADVIVPLLGKETAATKRRRPRGILEGLALSLIPFLPHRLLLKEPCHRNVSLM